MVRNLHLQMRNVLRLMYPIQLWFWTFANPLYCGLTGRSELDDDPVASTSPATPRGNYDGARLDSDLA